MDIRVQILSNFYLYPINCLFLNKSDKKVSQWFLLTDLIEPRGA